MKKQREQRCAGVTELRIEQQDNDGLPVIEGHAAVFDSLSQDLGYIFPFKERIRSGAFKASVSRDDIRALWNHDANYVLGRNRAGTLELTETSKGLKVRIHPPDTTWAKDLTESIRRGDVTQMSFGFVVENEAWTVEDGQDVRTLEQVKLFDVSPVTFPAYLDTDVGVRSALDSYDKFKQERKQRQAEFERLKNKFKSLKED